MLALYKLVQRMPASLRRSPPRPRLGRMIGGRGFVPTCLYVALILKGFLVILMDTKLAAGLRWLDCFLVGRFQMGTRIPHASKYIFFYVYGHQLLSRVYLSPRDERSEPKFLRFMQFERADVVRWAEETSQQRKMFAQDYKSPASNLTRRANSLKWARPHPEDDLDGQNQTGESPCQGAQRRRGFLSFMRIESFRNPFEPRGEWIVRPHRDLEFWSSLRIIDLLFRVYFCLTGLTTTAASIIIVTPMFVTRRGFALIYYQCAHWISKLQPHEAAAFKLVYAANETLTRKRLLDRDGTVPLMLPLVDLQSLNPYQMARMVADFAEQILWTMEIVFIYACHLFTIALTTLDVLVYADCIERKLETLNEAFKRRHYLEDCFKAHNEKSGSAEVFSSFARREFFAAASSRPRRRARREPIPLQPYPRVYYEHQVVEVQALLLDYFRLIAGHSETIRKLLLVDLLIMLVHTSVLYAIWLTNIRVTSSIGRGAEVELFGLFASAVVFTSGLLGLAAAVESKSRQLYHRIVVAMALDFGVFTTKLRWIKLIRFYLPRRLYCFKLLAQEPISWLFMLKIYSWTFSAFIVIKSLTA